MVLRPGATVADSEKMALVLRFEYLSGSYPFLWTGYGVANLAVGQK